VWAHVQRNGLCDRQCTGLIRIFDDDAVWGDEYRYVFPFRMVDERTIELVGIVGRAPTPSEARCMLRECRRRGWSVVRERKSGARQGVRRVDREDL